MKTRLDELLVQKNFIPSRTRAREIIRAGRVMVNDVCADKPGKEYTPDCVITIKKNRYEYVSRGAYKLEPALETLNLDVSNKNAVDIGASTGGFTQLLLVKGAGKVYAVDVGHGQLDWSLRNDKRIRCIEGYNARYFRRKEIIEDGDSIFLVTVDVSFISLTLILPPLVRELEECPWFILLVKPQFEAPRKECKKGVIKNPEVITMVLEKIKNLALSLKLTHQQTLPSPLRGPKGNQEYIMVFKQ